MSFPLIPGAIDTREAVPHDRIPCRACASVQSTRAAANPAPPQQHPAASDETRNANSGKQIHTPPTGYQLLDFSDINAPKLTHQLLRFPAKFHPPLAHKLIQSFTDPNDIVLDPFCGSGTLLLAATVEGRKSVGVDIDPLAVLATKAKTHRLQPAYLRTSIHKLVPELAAVARPSEEYSARRFEDITLTEYDNILTTERLWIPVIPNMFHWFRRYVIIDLARILKRIQDVDIPETHRRFLHLIFASIIRNSSNADPVPVSGLEVTSHMKKIDAAGRIINPFALFGRAVTRGLDAVEAYWDNTTATYRPEVFHGDATRLKSTIRRRIDAVVTSPPYHNAVDYYRRHKLEMFWLGLTTSQSERLTLLSKYIGRARIPQKDSVLQRVNELQPLSAKWHKTILQVSPARAAAFAHYSLSMQDTLTQLAMRLRPGGYATFVLGHSSWNGTEIPTSDLFEEMAGQQYILTNKLWYPVKNRYMSYGRRNGANINQEYVLVFKRASR